MKLNAGFAGEGNAVFRFDGAPTGGGLGALAGPVADRGGGHADHRYRRLTRNLEQSGDGKNVVDGNLRRVLRVLTRLDQNLV